MSLMDEGIAGLFRLQGSFCLGSALAERGAKVQLFELSTKDVGKLAMAPVDAETIVIGTPTGHVGPHPSVFAAAHLANAFCAPN